MPFRARRPLGLGLGLLALAGPLATGCAKKKPSAIVVSLSSEAPVPEELDQMEILVQRGDDTRHLGQYTLDVSAGDTRLPGTLTLQKEDGEESSAAITVTVTASAGSKKRVLRKATLGFSEEKTKLLKMPLRYSCFDFKELCAANEECVGGVCQDVKIDVETLPDYEDRLVFGTAAAKSCFDETEGGCFAGSATLDSPATAVVDAPDGTCTVALGNAARGGKGLNVGLRWSASGSLGRFATLEQESGRLVEGFSHDGNGNVRFPKGICAALKDGRVTALRTSTACATKATEQPLCVFQESVCRTEKKPATLATSACFQCLYAPSSPKNCAALLDAARCDDASRDYLSCLLDTTFSGFTKPADCPEPRRAACATKLGECANDLNGAACTQKYAKLLAYVACTDEVNGGLADDSAADLAAALARCKEPCAKDGYVQGCTSSAPMSYVAPLPQGNYADGKGNYVVVGSTDVQLRFASSAIITLVSSSPQPVSGNTTRYVATVLSTLGAPKSNPGGWPTSFDATPESGGVLWVQSIAGDVRVDLTPAQATAPGSGFAAAGPFSSGGAEIMTCKTASPQKYVFCTGGTELVICDPTTRSQLSTQPCPAGCVSAAASQNDACNAVDGGTCGDGVIDAIEGCDDKNTKTGDGCSGSCQVESGFLCGGTPSSCSSQVAACGSCISKTACGTVACASAMCLACQGQLASGATVDQTCLSDPQFALLRGCACGTCQVECNGCP